MESLADGIWWGHVVATWYMTGLIWYVQAVHYPLMKWVPEERYVAFQLQHVKRTSWVVGPPMLLESFTAVALLYVRPALLPELWAWWNFGLLMVVWISTAALQVPCHQRLTSGFDAAAHSRLVLTNWIRTLIWSGRAGLLLYRIVA
jgi:hypothetical protein